MMRRSGSDGGSSVGSESSSSAAAGEVEWEVRPGGMLVQKRGADADSPAAPLLRLRVSYGAAKYEVSISARSTYGELKKILASETGLQAGEQRTLYRGKVRENGEYLDVCGVKNRSKVVMVVDPASLERRYVELRRNAKIQSAHRAIYGVSMEVDKLADQVSTIEKAICDGNKVEDIQITMLIELLMKQAVKLDSIHSDEDTSPQKNIQAKRVQRCVETLDMLKISNSQVKTAVFTTIWETFEAPNITHWEIFD